MKQIDKESKFYSDQWPKSKGIVEWWGGFEKEEVADHFNIILSNKFLFST